MQKTRYLGFSSFSPIGMKRATLIVVFPLRKGWSLITSSMWRTVDCTPELFGVSFLSGVATTMRSACFASWAKVVLAAFPQKGQPVERFGIKARTQKPATMEKAKRIRNMRSLRAGTIRPMPFSHKFDCYYYGGKNRPKASR